VIRKTLFDSPIFVVVRRAVTEGSHCFVLQVFELIKLLKHVVAVVIQVGSTTNFVLGLHPSLIQKTTDFLVDAIVDRRFYFHFRRWSVDFVPFILHSFRLESSALHLLL
jgi:hypothetical protein